MLQRITSWIFFALACCAFDANAQYCRLSCSGPTGEGPCTLDERPLSQDLAAGQDCSGLKGKVGGNGIAVWQLEKGDLVFRQAEANSLIEHTLAKADRVGTGLFAFLRRPRSGVPAGSPFDKGKDDGSNSSGAAIGLPFGLILPPHRPAVLVDAAPGDADGELSVVDGATNRPIARLPVRGGVIPFDKLSLPEKKVYRYSFASAGNRKLEGTFSVTSVQTERDVSEETEYVMGKDKIPPRHREMVRAARLMEYDLRWDAMQSLANRGSR